jgi:hypothetical protein
MFHDSYVAGMSRFTPSPLEYDGAVHEGISPALRRHDHIGLHGRRVMHDMITSGSMAAA